METVELSLDNHQAKLLQAVAMAAPENEKKSANRFYLVGVFLDPVQGRMVATDGHIMAYAELPCAKHLKKGVVIPLQLIQACKGKHGLNIEVKENGDLKLTDGFNTVSGQDRLQGPHYRGEYPDYMRCIPSDHAGANQIAWGYDVLVKINKIMRVMETKAISFDAIDATAANLGRIAEVQIVAMPTKYIAAKAV